MNYLFLIPEKKRKTKNRWYPIGEIHSKRYPISPLHRFLSFHILGCNSPQKYIHLYHPHFMNFRCVRCPFVGNRCFIFRSSHGVRNGGLREWPEWGKAIFFSFGWNGVPSLVPSLQMSYLYIRRFPKIGVPLVIIRLNGIFPWDKASSYGVSPIYGRPHEAKHYQCSISFKSLQDTGRLDLNGGGNAKEPLKGGWYLGKPSIQMGDFYLLSLTVPESWRISRLVLEPLNPEFRKRDSFRFRASKDCWNSRRATWDVNFCFIDAFPSYKFPIGNFPSPLLL